jgi:hypothetical protein
MMQDKLTQAARCALADLIGLYYEGGLSDPAKKTITELYEALKDKGEDVSDYQGDYANVVEDMEDDA